SNDVLQSVMHVDPQPPIPEKADLHKLTDLVDQGQYQSSEAIELMVSLNAQLGEQHPQLQKLQRSIARQKVLNG
ncbi:MAG: ATP-binding protein, partial [Gammaproteobacteria bacterium]|nr:ATP-binding protein [Gammaproteobacteria bacterium]